MHKISVRAFALAAMAAMAIPAAAQEPELKVNYNWTSPAETAAIKVLQEQLGKLGVKWQDFAVVQHDTGPLEMRARRR